MGKQYTFEGKTYNSLAEVCRINGRNLQRVSNRLKSGMSLDDAMKMEKNHSSKICTDHLGNVFNSVKEMLDYHNASEAAYYNGIKHGKPLSELLMIKRKTNEISDHLGNKFKSKADMARHWGIEPVILHSRLSVGWSLEQALNTPQETGAMATPGGIRDHKGILYINKKEMCKAYGIEYSTFKCRMSEGWDLERALTTPKIKRIRSSVDHNGNKFDTFKSMCNHWGINVITVDNRLRNGWSLEDALETPVIKNQKPNKDHLGITYSSFDEMCYAYDISPDAVYKRLQSGFTLDEALTKDIERKNISLEYNGKYFTSISKFCKEYNLEYNKALKLIRNGVDLTEVISSCSVQDSKKDNKISIVAFGKEYKSYNQIYKDFGVTKDTFNRRISLGIDIEDALTFKGIACPVTDHTGKTHISVEKMCEQYGIDSITFNRRIRRGWSVEQALLTPYLDYNKYYAFGIGPMSQTQLFSTFGIRKVDITNRVANGIEVEVIIAVSSDIKTYRCSDIVKFRFVGLDNKAYYTVPWNNKPVTTRQIIEHYRPDLLDAYDKHNSTGEYRPYKKEEKPNV